MQVFINGVDIKDFMLRVSKIEQDLLNIQVSQSEQRGDIKDNKENTEEAAKTTNVTIPKTNSALGSNDQTSLIGNGD